MIRILLTWSVLVGVLAFSSVPEAQCAGLTSVSPDGFETGDWRNFRPRYVGDAEHWIRPQFTVSQENPIAGAHSLRWRSDDEEHQWLMLSNAFYLRVPMTLSYQFRVESQTDDWALGLILLEQYDRFSGLQIGPNQGILHLDASQWEDGERAEHNAEVGEVYRIELSLDDANRLQGRLTSADGAQTLLELSGHTCLDPVAMAIYVYTGAGSETVIDFDEAAVDSAPFRMVSNEWTRSPHFVVLPRLGDVPQEEGNWVGAASVIQDEDSFSMWYRIRNNQQRGAGYGFASSQNGLDWNKYENNPLFTHDPEYTSNEKIAVLRVDGLYRAWYAVDTSPGWYTAYATSEDGLEWKQHGLVIDDAMCKDADVLYVDGTYYLYAISPNNTSIAAYTSSDGVEWERRAWYPMGTHRHVAAYYVRSTETFWLYASGGQQGVSRASSKNGVDFTPFKQTWTTPAVGLDDWDEAGITYLSFLRDQHGQIEDDLYLPMYYQARNTYANNIPGWLYHGGERVVLAGRFDGLYPGVPTWLHADGRYEYEAFPFEVPRARGLQARASFSSRMELDAWAPEDDVIASGRVEAPRRTQIQWILEGMTPGGNYAVELGNQSSVEGRADSDGNVWLITIVEEAGTHDFRIIQGR